MAQLWHFPGWFRTPRPGSALLAALLVAGCPGEPPPGGPPDAPNAPSPPLTLADLRGASFPSDLQDGRVVTLGQGRGASTDTLPPSESDLVLVAPAAFGDIPGLGPVAAAVVVESGGGTGTFSWLHLLARVGGDPAVVASGYLGDRVEVTGLRFAGDTLVVRLVVQGPEDPMCCPTMVVERRYRREGKGLHEVSGKREDRET